MPNLSSPLVVDGLLFMVSDKGGTVMCLGAKTGEQIWRDRLPGGGQNWASPIYADGKLYFSNTKGEVSVIAAAPEYQLLAQNIFEGTPGVNKNNPRGGFVASPAVAGDAIILRSETHLYCIDGSVGGEVSAARNHRGTSE